MEQAHLSWIANFIWVTEDVLRDLYVRGKYCDVILPMTVLRRFDAVLEPTKKAVLELKRSLDEAGIVHQDAALRQAAGPTCYNTSKFTLRDLRARASQQQFVVIGKLDVREAAARLPDEFEEPFDETDSEADDVAAGDLDGVSEMVEV